MSTNEQVTLAEAASTLSIPLETVRGWAKRGKIYRANLIRATGPGRRRLVAVYDLDEVRAVAARMRNRDTPKVDDLADK